MKHKTRTESGVSSEKIVKKYHISSRSVLFSWMDKFLNEKDLLPLHRHKHPWYIISVNSTVVIC